MYGQDEDVTEEKKVSKKNILDISAILYGA